MIVKCVIRLAPGFIFSKHHSQLKNVAIAIQKIFRFRRLNGFAERFASAQFEKCNFFSFKKDFYSSVICARPSFTLRNSTVKMQKETFSIPAIQHCLKIWTIPGLFSVYFCLFKQTIQFLQQVNVKNFHLV